MNINENDKLKNAIDEAAKLQDTSACWKRIRQIQDIELQVPYLFRAFYLTDRDAAWRLLRLEFKHIDVSNIIKLIDKYGIWPPDNFAYTDHEQCPRCKGTRQTLSPEWEDRECDNCDDGWIYTEKTISVHQARKKVEDEIEQEKKNDEKIRRIKTIEGRRKSKLCIYCGHRLGIFERLSSKDCHKKCNSFTE